MGTLNFLNWAIVPACAFTRRMYSKLVSLKNRTKTVLKFYHHITLDVEFINDCKMWELFLTSPQNASVMCHPFLDIVGIQTATELQFYTDASPHLSRGGFGCYFNGKWMAGICGEKWMKKFTPSIEFLELYALECLHGMDN